MIVPGLDRLDGTAVNGELLDSDELWHEHTTEILELFEFENQNKNPEDFISMIEFCTPYANGKKFTQAMRRARAKKEWRIDPYAVQLVSYEKKLESLGSDTLPLTFSGHQSKRKNKNSTACVAPEKAAFNARNKVSTPGLVFCIGAGFPYCDSTSSILKKGLIRLKNILSLESLYVTPDHAMHITICTLQKFSVEPVENQVVIPLGQTLISALYPTTFYLPTYVKWLQTDTERKIAHSVKH